MFFCVRYCTYLNIYDSKSLRVIQVSAMKGAALRKCSLSLLRKKSLDNVSVDALQDASVDEVSDTAEVWEGVGLWRTAVFVTIVEVPLDLWSQSKLQSSHSLFQ